LGPRSRIDVTRLYSDVHGNPPSAAILLRRRSRSSDSNSHANLNGHQTAKIRLHALPDLTILERRPYISVNLAPGT
jgi:predicted solute-binding protein